MIDFTEAALKKLSHSVEPGDIVRIGVRAGGCSGMSYSMSVEEEYSENDTLLEFDNLKICIDKKSAFMLTETILDYVETFSSSGFKFSNARATKTCGCGESFSC